MRGRVVSLESRVGVAGYGESIEGAAAVGFVEGGAGAQDALDVGMESGARMFGQGWGLGEPRLHFLLSGFVVPGRGVELGIVGDAHVADVILAGFDAANQMGGVLGGAGEAASAAAYEDRAEAVECDKGGHVGIAQEAAGLGSDEGLQGVHGWPFAWAMALRAASHLEQRQIS